MVNEIKEHWVQHTVMQIKSRKIWLPFNFKELRVKSSSRTALNHFTDKVSELNY